MKFIHLTHFAASTYNCGAYGAGGYNETDCATSTTGETAGSGSLADTGADLLLYALIGVILVGLALFQFIRSFRKARASR